MNIEVEDRVLTVSGERKAEHTEAKDGFHRVERAFGSFSRSLTLPEGVDAEAVTASFDQRRARGADPEARAAQAAQDLDRRRRRAEDDRRRSRPPSRTTRGRLTCRPRVLHPHQRSGLLRPHRHAQARPRRGPHARVRPAGDQGRRQDARGPRGRRPRLRHGAREHVPPVPLARPRADRAARRAAPLPALGQADHHRLRRLPGLLDGPRHGRRRDQGPRGAVRRRALRARSWRSRRRACASAPTSTARRSSWARRPRWRSRRALGSDIALVFDECTPFHADREYTARSTERTHRWLDRCLAWHDAARTRGPARLRDRPGRDRRGPAPLLRAGGRRARRARRDRDRRLARRGQGRRCSRSSSGRSRSCRRRKPRHLLGIGEVDDLVRGVELGIDTFDCAMPTRIGRHGMAIVPDPAKRWRVDLAKARWKRGRRAAAARAARARPASRATPAPTCTTCCGPRSRPRCACSRSTTSPTCSA